MPKSAIQQISAAAISFFDTENLPSGRTGCSLQIRFTIAATY